MKVPFVDLQMIHRPLTKQFQDVFREILDTNEFIAGNRTQKFEESFAQLVGAKHAVLVNNGTTALFMALKALNLPEKSKVLLPVNTFIATAEAVSLAGLTPVFIDINAQTLLMDIEKCMQSLDKQVSAIIPVNLYGRQFPIQALKKRLKSVKHKVSIVEDACQSHGAYEGKKPSISADFSCYSFYPGKNLGALGEAGAIVTNSQKQYDWLMLYRSHGSKVKYVHDIVGMNFRANEMEAAFLNIKLPHLKKYNRERYRLAQQYHAMLQHVPQVILPTLPPEPSHVYHLFIARVKKRAQLQAYLLDKGVQTALHYPTPLHFTKAYKYLDYRKGAFPMAEKTVKEILSLPMYAGMTLDQVEYVCEQIKAFYAKS